MDEQDMAMFNENPVVLAAESLTPYSRYAARDDANKPPNVSMRRVTHLASSREIPHSIKNSIDVPIQQIKCSRRSRVFVYPAKGLLNKHLLSAVCSN